MLLFSYFSATFLLLFSYFLATWCYFFSLLFNQFQPNSSLLFTLRSLKLTQIKRIQFNFISRNVSNFPRKTPHFFSLRRRQPEKEKKWVDFKMLNTDIEKWPKIRWETFERTDFEKLKFQLNLTQFWSFLGLFGSKTVKLGRKQNCGLKRPISGQLQIFAFLKVLYRLYAVQGFFLKRLRVNPKNCRTEANMGPF